MKQEMHEAQQAIGGIARTQAVDGPAVYPLPGTLGDGGR
jgi:hypothetical protein